MSQQSDEEARMTHIADQGVEGAKTIADMTHAFYSKLLEHGMSPEFALELTQTWLRSSTGGQNVKD